MCDRAHYFVIIYLTSLFSFLLYKNVYYAIAINKLKCNFGNVLVQEILINALLPDKGLNLSKNVAISQNLATLSLSRTKQSCLHNFYDNKDLTNLLYTNLNLFCLLRYTTGIFKWWCQQPERTQEVLLGLFV